MYTTFISKSLRVLEEMIYKCFYKIRTDFFAHSRLSVSDTSICAYILNMYNCCAYRQVMRSLFL